MNGDGLHFTSEAAHSDSRIIHVKDQTGKGIQEKILEVVEKNQNISVLTEHFAVDLLTLSHHSKIQRIFTKSLPALVQSF